MSRKDVSFGNRTKALSQAMSNASQSFWSPRSCTYVAVAPRLSGYKVIFLRSNSLALSTLSVEYQYSPAAVSAALDEIEKAHPDVFNVLLQVLDDGHITDSKGRKVSFKNTVLIMTSNAGAQRIVDPKNLGFATEKSETKDYEKMKSNVMEEVKRSFKPEFINRIDDIIVFHQLNNENMKEIVNLLASNLYKRCEDQLGIHLTITAALKEHLVKKYADNKMGARPLKRAIQSVVEDALAEEILLKKVVPGDKVSAGFKNGKVVFTVKN